MFGRIFTEIKKNVLRFHFIQNENKFIILVCMTTVSPVTSFKEQKNLEYAFSHLFCTLISENQGLEKLRSILNLRKISFYKIHGL